MNRWRILIVLSLLLAFIFTAQAVVPQENPRPNESSPRKLAKEEPVEDRASRHADPIDVGEREHQSRPDPNAVDVTASTGGPDAFGYKWDDGLPFQWPDATQGSRSNISGDDNYGLIDLGFSFPYYEQNRSNAFVSTNGFLSFGDGTSGCCGGYPIPLQRYPNNVIAPYWSDLVIDPGQGGGIWLLRGGQSPNRYIVIEWHDAEIYGYGGQITFAVKLKEDGTITMSYADMDEQEYGSSGIEDSTGYIGLPYRSWPNSYTTVAFHPPAPSRGGLAYPPRQGELASAGGSQMATVFVQNNGRLGSDTFDITVNSTWPAQVTRPGGVPLTDSNGNSLPDTGPLPQGGAITLYLSVSAPTSAPIGASNVATLAATSTADSSKISTARFETAVPAAHAQAIIEDHEGEAMGINLLQTKGQRKTFTSSPYQYPSDPAIAETASGGFVNAWSRGWYTSPDYAHYTTRLFIAVTDKFGALARNVQTPFDPALAYAGVLPEDAYDWDAALAAAPNGHTAVVWKRYLYNPSAGYNMNIFFALLNQSGKVIKGPLNVSNLTAWGRWGDPNYHWVGPPRIAATQDGRYVIAWGIEEESSDGYYLESVYYAVVDSGGSLQRSPVRITKPDLDKLSWSPALAAAPNNQATLFYSYEECSNNDCDESISYSIIDAQNNISTKGAVLAPNEYQAWNTIDSALLSDGRTMVTWSRYDDLRYAVLSPQQTVAVPPRWLRDPLSRFGMYDPSVAPAGAGKAVVTARDGYNLNISYALLDSSGSILTEPHIAYRGRSDLYPFVSSGNNGSGTTSYSWQPVATADAAVTFPLPRVGGLPGHEASIPVSVANLGQSKATGVELSVTLGPGLTYAADDSGLTPTIEGSKLTWQLPDLLLLQSFKFNIRAQIPPAAPLGKLYNVTASVAVQNSDASPGNNTAAAKVMSSSQALMPITIRP